MPCRRSLRALLIIKSPRSEAYSSKRSALQNGTDYLTKTLRSVDSVRIAEQELLDKRLLFCKPQLRVTGDILKATGDGDKRVPPKALFIDRLLKSAQQDHLNTHNTYCIS